MLFSCSIEPTVPPPTEAALTAAATLFLGVLPSSLLSLVQQATQALFG